MTRRLVTWGILLLALAAAGCGDEGGIDLGDADGGLRTLDATSDEPDASDEEELDLLDGAGDAITCPTEHVVDGRFTGWPDDPDCEWTADPVEGQLGDFYVEVVDDELYVLNDWYDNTDAPISDDQFNLFVLATADGAQIWRIRVFGDQRVEVTLNGEEVPDQEVGGAAGFHASPAHEEPHTIYEFAISGVQHGGMQMKAADPPCADCDNVWAEVTIDGEIDAAGNVETEATTAPTLAGLDPPVGQQGDEVRLIGANLGSEEGTVRFGEAEAEIVSWSDGQIRVIAPSIPASRDVRAVTADDEETNPLRFRPTCIPDCEDRACGPDGCGGSCGTCGDGKTCEDGACVCEPECSARACGPDGCGGTCGGCEGEATCVDGTCCEPDCAGQECGPDGCGGTCGDCALSNASCESGDCVCDPSCGGKECGSDGCGGSCGTCSGDAKCVEGSCCEPSCGGKECGSDGCGGFCGVCVAPDASCEAGKCVCEPDCAGKKCGADGCGGSCGTCSADAKCVEGSCCEPDCSGKECGPDGCGGNCGGCPEPQAVCEDGACVCEPDCSGKDCGPDGCGGTCGDCGGSATCVEGACCEPDCTDKECGSDGCGGTCGTCSGETSCVEGSCCEPDCSGQECGSDGCGGTCGSCSSGESCIEGSCY